MSSNSDPEYPGLSKLIRLRYHDKPEKFEAYIELRAPDEHISKLVKDILKVLGYVVTSARDSAHHDFEGWKKGRTVFSKVYRDVHIEPSDLSLIEPRDGLTPRESIIIFSSNATLSKEISWNTKHSYRFISTREFYKLINGAISKFNVQAPDSSGSMRTDTSDYEQRQNDRRLFRITPPRFEYLYGLADTDASLSAWRSDFVDNGRLQRVARVFLQVRRDTEIITRNRDQVDVSDYDPEDVTPQTLYSAARKLAVVGRRITELHTLEYKFDHVPGFNYTTVKALKNAGYTTVDEVQTASKSDIAGVIGDELAARIGSDTDRSDSEVEEADNGIFTTDTAVYDEYDTDSTTKQTNEFNQLQNVSNNNNESNKELDKADQSIEKLKKYTQHNIKKPIHIASVDKPDLLFYLAFITPISRSDFAEECESTNITPALEDRFSAEIDLDMFGYIQLSPAARRPVIKASEPYLHAGQKLLQYGKSLASDRKFDPAVECFTDAVSIFELVNSCFEGVKCDSEEVNELLNTAKRYHDLATKEVAKQLINQNIDTAQQHETKGDKLAEHDASKAIDEYQTATNELAEAVDSARRYNKKLQHTKTSALSINPLKKKADSIKNKSRTIERQASDPNWASSGTELREAYNTVTDLEKESVVELEKAGYTAVSDLADMSKEQLTQFDSVDHSVASELLEFARNKAYIKEGKMEADNTSKKHVTETSTLENRLEEHYQQDDSEGENWYRCRRTTEDGEICNTKVYYSPKNRSDLRKHEKKHTTSKIQEPKTETLEETGESYSYIKKNGERSMLETIRGLHKQLGRVPKTTELPEECEYSPNDFYQVFGTWNKALEAAGIDKKLALLEEIERVAEKLGRVPNTTDMDEHGSYSGSSYSAYFGSWHTALEQSDVEEDREQRLLETLQSLDDRLGRLPKTPDLYDVSGISLHDYIQEFGSWDEALEAAGIDKEQALLENIEQVAEKLERVPKSSDMDEHGTYSQSLYSSYFDSWESAVERSEVEENRDKKLLETLRSLHDRLDRPPKITDLHDVSDVCQQDYIQNFGSWDEALEAAGLSSLDKAAETDQGTEEKQSGSATVTPSAPIEDIIPKVDGLGPHSISRLRSAGYTTLGDLCNVEPAEVARNKGIGRQRAIDLIRFVTENVSGDDNSPNQSSNYRSNVGQSSPSIPRKNSNRILPGALDSSWETIPNNRRIDGQFILNVVDVDRQVGERKTARLGIRDQNGREFKMNIWSKHDVDREWVEGEWYAVENALGKMWESSNGTKRKLLNSTKDLSVFELGSDFDPTTTSTEDMLETASGPQQSEATTNEDVSGSASHSTAPSRDRAATTDDGESSENDSPEVDDNGVLGDIMSDFDEI